MNKQRILEMCVLFALLLSSPSSYIQNFKAEMTSSIDILNPNAGGSDWINGRDKYGNLGDMPIETVISRRISIHYGNYYSNTTIPLEVLLKVLWAAYGYSWRGRTVPSISGYPVIVYVCNESAAYKFIPENQSLTLWKKGDYRNISGGYPAPIQMYIAFDMNICTDIYWGNAESGFTIQNIYLMANILNLGTVCEGGTWLDRTYIHHTLGLPENQKVLYKMPLGYPLPPYTSYQNLVPTSRPSSSKLPEIQDSIASLNYSLDSVFSSHKWSENPVTRQELSQILWASYGYSYFKDTALSPPQRHRTVPSASSNYPMRIYAANASGVYQYLPEQHTLTTIVAEDRRSRIAQASRNTWASSAPLIIAIAWDDRHILTVDTTYVEVGLITQNVFLESAAWGLIADWGRADTNEEAMREALGFIGETHLHPVSIITVGHPLTYLHKVEWNKMIYSVETKTNSTVLNLALDKINRKISFNVTGPSGTIGFCNTTIPKTLLSGDLTVLVNGNAQTNLAQRDNATHVSLYFTYQLPGTAMIQIVNENALPKFPIWAPILLVFLTVAVVTVFWKRKLLNVHKQR